MTLAARIATLAAELEADPGYGGRYDASMDCAERLREILAEVNQTTVWAVANHDYDDTSTVAIFTSQELADQHAADRDGGYEVIEHDILDHRPVKVSLEYRSASVFDDGHVDRHNQTSRPQEYWDYEAPTRLNMKVGEHCTTLGVHAEPGTSTAELLRHVDLLLDGYATAGGWTDTMLTAAKMQARWDRPPTRKGVCYRTASGLAVHVRAGCRC